MLVGAAKQAGYHTTGYRDSCILWKPIVPHLGSIIDNTKAPGSSPCRGPAGRAHPAREAACFANNPGPALSSWAVTQKCAELNSLRVCVLKDFGVLVAAAQPWEAEGIWVDCVCRVDTCEQVLETGKVSVSVCVLEGSDAVMLPFCSVVLGQSNTSSAHTS